MKILLVDKDKNSASIIKKSLEKSMYAVDVAYDSRVGEKMVTTGKYNIIIMEVLLPGLNGFELCKNIRNFDVKTPIMMLTSLKSIADKVNGFNCGADDYLVKPFDFLELHARIKALDRRYTGTILHSILKLADLEMDTVSKKVIRNNKIIKLTELEYRLLELLMSNQGYVFDRVEITEKIWGQDFNSGTNVVDVHINGLRNKIGKSSSDRLIHTIIGIGYAMYELT